ncbi:aldehyde dehydrogenase family protein [archaeon]|nr:MAG: aldehyde dehydrogenase family protein [archaeon]
MEMALFEKVGVLASAFIVYKLFLFLWPYVSVFLQTAPPKVTVKLTKEELEDKLEGCPKFDPRKLDGEREKVYMWDPSTYDYLGETPAMSAEQVQATVQKARIAQAEWKKSSFATRKLLMRTMLRYITENQEHCARVAVRESGKTLLDALIGEVLVTCEKLIWLANSGEQWLLPEYRESGRMMMLKQVHVEYVPLGVIGAIVPWNYPFHNVFNPVSAALFTGNSIVIKVSEYASWSIRYYKAIIDACLDVVHAPRDLVQFVVGYGATGSALVTSGVDKVIFVGSPGVGAMVAKTAADNLTPVVLELGGKDPFIVCEDADIPSIVQTACRGVWQNMGQNCAGPERFFVYESVYDMFCDGVTKVVKNMKIGPSLGDPTVDCGAICMGPKQMLHYQKLVDDAVIRGAKVLAGGFIPSGGNPLTKGSFYPPTILANVPEDALIAQEEIFGPIMAIFKVRGNNDQEAVRMANNCDFALSSCAFSGNAERAKAITSQLVAGMTSVNDLEGTTYMSQSLPFGGCKKSGYDRFAGPEGLRGLCMIKSVCEDLIPFIRNSIPPPMQYPATGHGHTFAQGLIRMFYSTTWTGTLQGLWTVTKISLVGDGGKKN